MRTHPFGAALLAVAALSFSSCGGGLGSGDPPVIEPFIQTEAGVPALDGYVLSDGTAVTSGGTPCVGDLDAVENGLGSRQFFAFDISSIPPGSTILRADFFAQQVGRDGTPHLTHGATTIEAVDYGDTLDGSDFDVPAYGHSESHLSTDPTSGFLLDFVDEVQTALDEGRTYAQFRFRCFNFDSDGDGVSDHTIWADSEVGAPAGPTLTIVYLSSLN